MSWLSDIAAGDLRRLVLTRVELAGVPSCVTAATFELHYADGRVERRAARFPDGVIYESFVAQVRGVNRLLGG